MSKKKTISTEEFEKLFDENKEDILQYVDTTTVRHPNAEPKRVNVDFPLWMVAGLDSEATRLGVTRQSLIKMWIGSMLDDLHESQRAKDKKPAKD